MAIDKEHAERLAARLARVTGEPPAIVTSDAADASQRIQRFAAGAGSWLVSVLMVSEGVDIPRLRVGVYATSARTELFFRQVVGRFIRRTPVPKQQMSHLFLPSDPTLKRLAAQIEEERNHALVQLAEGEAVERGERTESDEGFRALWSSARRDDDVLRTTQPGESLQLFAEAAPAPSPALAAFTTTEPDPEAAHERRERLRDERRALVAVIARATGEEHRTVNARINRAVGVASVAKSTVAAARARERAARARGRPPPLNAHLRSAAVPGWPESLTVLRERPYRLLFAGQAVSLLGDSMVNVSLAFAVIGLGGSAAEIGLVFTARSLALIGCLLAGGVVADRLPRADGADRRRPRPRRQPGRAGGGADRSASRACGCWLRCPP